MFWPEGGSSGGSGPALLSAVAAGSVGLYRGKNLRHLSLHFNARILCLSYRVWRGETITDFQSEPFLRLSRAGRTCYGPVRTRFLRWRSSSGMGIRQGGHSRLKGRKKAAPPSSVRSWRPTPRGEDTAGRVGATPRPGAPRPALGRRDTAGIDRCSSGRAAEAPVPYTLMVAIDPRSTHCVGTPLAVSTRSASARPSLK